MANGPGQPPETCLYRWRFGTVEFDEARHELRVAGLVVEIEHRPQQVLALLLRHVGEVVTKEELFEQVWANRITVDHVLATAIGKLRKAIVVTGEQRIVTVPRVGYRLDGPVERIAIGRHFGSGEMNFEAGQSVPGREHFVLERPLGRTLGNEVWLAKHPRSHEARVFKFSLDSERLSTIKREATLMRVLRDTLGERDDLVRLIDWNFESEPFFLECEYGGQSLLEWSQESDVFADWDRERRLAFFLQIATAVDAAHDVGVLHKDIKPANVLVRQRSDGHWQACLTDFGNSRLLQPERLAELGITALGMTMSISGSDSSGTPLYLAPELIAGQPPTVRSDLYALGILLYQMLAGDLRRPMAPGWERDIDDPLLVEDITAATDGDPAQRLGSVATLIKRLSSLDRRRADAIQRAQTERTALKAQRVLERARTRRPWIIATIAMLSIGLLVSSLLWYRSVLDRRDATMQAARAEAVVRFLSDDLIGSVSPGGAGFERDPTVREMLEHAAIPLADQFKNDPATRGSIQVALGAAWRALGDRKRGAEYLRKAVQSYASAFGADDPLTLKTQYSLVRTLAYVGTADSFAKADKVLAEADRLAGDRLRGANELALRAAIGRGQYHYQLLEIEPALAANRRADALQRKLRPDDTYMASLIRQAIADCLMRLGKHSEAIVLLQAMLSDPLLDATRIGETSIAGIRMHLARAFRHLGRYREALPLAQAAVTATERILGPDQYTTLINMSTLYSIHDELGNCTKALPIAREVRRRMAARFGEHKVATLIETGNLGFVEIECGDREAGLDYLRQADSNLRRLYGEDNAAAQAFRFGLVDALTDDGRYSEALEVIDGLDASALLASDPRPGWQHRLRAMRGRILLESGEVKVGRELLRASIPALRKLGASDPAEIAELQQLLEDSVTVAANPAPATSARLAQPQE